MDPRRCVELRLELEVGAEPIAGRLRRGSDNVQWFHGWLELAAALEAALRAGGQMPPGERAIPIKDRHAKNT